MMVSQKTLVITSVVGALLVVGVVVMTVFLVSEHNKGTEPQVLVVTFPSMGSLLDYFGEDDALNIKWYHGANSLEQMEEALSGDYQMLEGDIILRWYGFPNQTEEPVMAHPPLYNSDNTLHNWLASIFQTTNKAPKLDFKGEDVIEPSLNVLQGIQDQVNHPVWANADIVKGPGTDQDPIDADKVFSLVNQYFPNMTLSLGWTTECCDENFSQEMMQEMWDNVQNITQPVTFPARAALFKGSWPQFKWLLLKDPDRFSITVWTPSTASIFWEGASIYDMLYVRNDIDKRLIYYDLPGPKFDEFRKLSVTGGSPLNHFDLEARDGLSITWAHAVNSQQDLQTALDSDVLMLEADVVLQGYGTPNQTNIPIMAHPPDIYSDITLEEWLTKVLNTTKGIKLDFKSIDVVEPAMTVLQSFNGLYHQPVWLNADILKGPNSEASTPVNATEFKRIILDNFPYASLSIGWTTRFELTGLNEYTDAMVTEMADYARDLDQPITYPIRAAFAKDSWDRLKALMDQSRSYTITIWSGGDLVDPDDLVYVRQNSEIDRVYYDLPNWLMEGFLERLNATSVASK